jgi:hypothetical protein
MAVEPLKNCPHSIEIGDSYASVSGRLVEIRLFGVFRMKIYRISSAIFATFGRGFFVVVLGKTPRELIVTDIFHFHGPRQTDFTRIIIYCPLFYPIILPYYLM